MEAESAYIRAGDGTRIFTNRWSPSQQKHVKGRICIVHGIGEHSGRYDHVVKRLVEEGYYVFTFDLRGHGRSGGRKGDVTSVDQFLDDINFMLKETKQLGSGKLFLYGHSMGGNIVTNYVLRRQPKLDGVIVTSPWYKISVPPSPLLVSIGRMLMPIWPSFSMNRGGDPSNLFQGAKAPIDPMFHDRITVRCFFQLLEAGLSCLQEADQLSIPMLLMHGTEDRVTLHDASQAFSEKARPYCEFVSWPGGFHELHNEPFQEQVLTTIVNWINKESRV